MELLLPRDHPIWNYPRGMRRTKAVEYLDMGIQISEHLKRIEKMLEACLKKIPDKMNPPAIEPGGVRVDIEGFGDL